MSNSRTVIVVCLIGLVSLASAQTRQSSVVDAEKRVDSILGKMTIEEKIDYIGGINDFYLKAMPRVGLPEFRMSDGPMGVHDYGLTTAYPAGIAVAATWNTDLAERVGLGLGKDARARGVHFVLGPAMNIYRAPMCGRNFEYFGEDPFLASRMAVSVVKGIQGQGVIATAKHFAANNQEFERYNVSSDVDERTLREIYLPAFEAAVKEGKVGAVMNSYNPLNGVHTTQNNHLNNEILKQDWGFDGILMSDWESTHDGVAAANGGLDLEMPSGKFMNRKTLLPAIQEGKVSVVTIDDKVRRLLRKEIQFGFLDRQQTDNGIPLYNQESRQIALEASRESMVLLKNARSLLPLDPARLKTVAVLGPDAFPAVVGGGGSSLTAPFHGESYLEGISNYLGTRVKVLYPVDLPPIPDIFDKTEFVTEPNGPAGLKAEYFNNENFQGAPALTRIDRHVSFKWGDGSYADDGPADHFSVRWTGYFVPIQTADYKFYSFADDGVRLYLDDQRVIDDWTTHAETLDSYSVHLQQGHAYKIRFEYFEATGGASAGFGVAGAETAVSPEAKALAAKADVAIVCVGFSPTLESEGSDRMFTLPSGQDELIRQISAVNKNTIVVITAGGNVDMTQWIDSVPVILHAWYPGQEGGTALAQLLFGDYSPSGKLPASFERRWEDSAVFHSYYPNDGEKRVQYSEGVFLGYRHFDRSEVKPLFPFGYGLSYTTFAYSKLSVSPRTGNLNEPVTVSFDVKNTGRRTGAEVAELYVGDSHSGVPRPVKELKGFAKVQVKPGETKRVSLTLNRRAFSYYDVNRKDWNAESGEFGILVGGSSDKIELKGAFTLTP